MTPKEKAFELVAKFSPILPFYSVMDNLNKSKQCALIAVDEIISDNASIYSQQYWNEVKQEINKL